MKRLLICATVASCLVALVLVAYGTGLVHDLQRSNDFIKGDGPLESSVEGLDARRLRASNSSLKDARRLIASPGCLACCGIGGAQDCSHGFQGTQMGICCNSGAATKDTAMCCPANAMCNVQQNGCMRQQPMVTHTQTMVHRRSYWGHPYGYSHRATPMVGIVIALSCIICFLLMFCCMAAQSQSRPQTVNAQTGVVTGTPVYHTAGGYGTDPVLAGGGGFLGGLALGSLLSGPSYGYGGWGGGYGGWGGDTYMVDTVTTTTGGGMDMFAADGGGFGGGDFGGGDFGGGGFGADM